MTPAFVLRHATRGDVPFLVTAVRAAESLGEAEGRCMYEAVYGLSGDEVDAFLASQLEAEVAGHPLSHTSFRIATAEGVPVATCATWVEEGGTRASGLRVAMAMSRFLGTARFNRCRDAIGVLAAAAPRRTPGAVQLESFFTSPAARGAGLASRLIDACLGEAPAVGRPAEIALLTGNRAALAAYARAGFVEGWRTPAGDARFRALTGHEGFVQVQRAPLLPAVRTA